MLSMKNLFENWRRYVNEEASKKQIEDAVVDTLEDEGGAAGFEPIKKAGEEIDVREGIEIFRQALQEKEGKKDACYHKVKARYDVWPSAYASGALVKCRKVGAANWGNKSKGKKK